MTDPFDPAAHPAAVAEAIATLDRFLAALNAGDAAAVAQVLHFPHYRLAGGRVTVWQDIADYMAGSRTRLGAEWHRTVCDFRRPVAAAPDKVHLDVQWTRLRADGSRITSFRALWVMALLEGRWAAQLRSSFGA
jgi:hypothetical protein